MRPTKTVKTISVVWVVILAVGSLGSMGPTDELDKFVLGQMAQREINGLSLAIIQDGKIEPRAYGVTSRSGAPVSPDTLFQAGSISKPVAAMGALRLVDQGLLALDDDVNGKLRTWKVPDNEFTTSQKVTLRRLLSHTAGLTVHGFPGYDVKERMPSAVAVLDGVGNTDPVRVNVVPGSISRYSGGGYTVAQVLVADVTGKPFAKFMSEAVLGPLGMSRSTYEQPLPVERAAQTASGYLTDRSPVDGRWHIYPEMAAAGLWTTPADLAKFAVEVQQSLAGKSNKVISQATTRVLLTDQMNSNYGLGLGLSGTGHSRTFGHNGRDHGFDASMIAFLETGQGLIVMINANDNSRMIARIQDFVARKYNWPAFATTPAAAKRLETTIPFDQIAGRYELSNNNMLTLIPHNGTLFTVVNGLPDEEFLSTGNDRFGSSERNVTFRVNRREDGEVTGLAWSAAGRERTIPRIGPLFTSLRQQKDLDPSFTQTVQAVVRALAQGGAAVSELSHLTPGARKDLSQPVRELAAVERVSYVAMQDLTGRQIERHGGAVNRVLFYRLETAKGSKGLLIHVTADNLITDYDVVDK